MFGDNFPNARIQIRGFFSDMTWSIFLNSRAGPGVKKIDPQHR